MIEPDLRAFLEGGLGIHVGTRTSRLEPNGARALAVKVEEDHLHLLVYLAGVAARRVVPDLRANSAIAVGFARPIDERACQIKGIFVLVRQAAADERPLIEEQIDGFLANLEHIGIPRIGTSAWVIWPAVAIRLRATTIFEQTPGPDAGTLVPGLANPESQLGVPLLARGEPRRLDWCPVVAGASRSTSGVRSRWRHGRRGDRLGLGARGWASRWYSEATEANTSARCL